MSRAIVVLIMTSVFALGVWPKTASAGTTGALQGTILQTSGRAPVANAVVSVTSPSQTASTRTDASGTFTFISLAPDTYTLAVMKQGFEPLSVPGVTILADQTQSLNFSLTASLRTIARVASRSALDVVRPGTTTDVYSVGPAQTAAAAPLGGSGSLNQAYSAIASVPGAYVPAGQMGVNQSVYIRGGTYSQIGYEYDGVPVNRSFDNYPGHSAATLGQQELQVYTGGGGAGQTATGLAGFINQVVKTGSYPSFSDFSARIGSPTFYHDLSGDFGGSTPNRRFNWYIGASGYNQDYRYFDNFNGAGLQDAFPIPYGQYGFNSYTTNLPFYPAVYPTCNRDLSSPFGNAGAKPPPFYNNDPSSGIYGPGCFEPLNAAYGNVSGIEGREIVANFHYEIPHGTDMGSDDVQFLFTNSAQFRQYYSGVDDAGFAQVAATGGAEWPDYLTYPSGTQFFAPATVQPVAYPFPGSPGGRCYNTSIPVPNSCATGYSALPPDYRDARWDTASIVKLQYQKNLGTKAYIRAFGYTFYSNTNRSGATRRGTGISGLGVVNYDYEVDSHTRGAELQFGDQIDDHNQLTGYLNYVTATTNRVNNYNYLNSSDLAVSNLTNGKQCFAGTDGTGLYPGQNGPETFAAGQPAPCNDPITQGTFAYPTGPCTVDFSQACASTAGSVPITEAQNCSGAGGAPIPGPACAAGASWRLTYTGNQGGLNTVTPKFLGTGLNDEIKPTDKLDINLGVRFERDQYDLANTDTPAKNFWFAAAQHEYCYNPVTLQPVFVPQSPQSASLQVPVVTFSCPTDSSSGTTVQTVHPDGLDGHLLLSNVYDPTLVQTFVEPRAGLTYTVDPNTVLRLNGGRYAQQPQAYEIQYNSIEPNLANQLIGFFPYGFTTPRHDALPQYSNNFDLSLEHRFANTDMSFKVTPYYRYATNQLYTVSVYGASPDLNSGIEKSQGVELQFTKGNFNRDGLSMVLAYTFLDSKEKWANYAGTNRNPVDPYNDYIKQYNALTKAGGGAPCYANSGDATPDPACAATSILNPYYHSAPQPLFDRNAYYQTGLDFPYLSPNVFSLVLNYRKGPLAVTPALQLSQGTWYGNPADVIGLDPRTCYQNQGTSGFSTGNPLKADYTSCGFADTPSGSLYVPNPETGHYDGFGEYQQPWQLNLGLQLTYAITPKVTANVTVANLVNRCFGGSSTPWSAAYPPGSTVCGYGSNTFYVNNFYNGASPYDAAANGTPLNSYFAHSFVPAYGDVSAYNYPMPLNVYFQLSVKL